MIDDDKKKFAEIIGATAAIHRIDATPELMRGFWMVLSDYSIEQVADGFAQHLKVSTFFPKPAEIINIINPAVTGREAWQEVFKMIGRRDKSGGYYGRDNAPRFDEVTQRALDNVGGFAAVCMTEMAQQTWLQKRFEEHYGTAEVAGSALIGRDEAKKLRVSMDRLRITKPKN